jgi:hypothetical protein
MTAVFAKTLVRAGQVRSFQVDYKPADGWESAAWINQDAAESQRHSDWHRAERAVSRFMREIAELRREGWREVGTPTT